MKEKYITIIVWSFDEGIEKEIAEYSVMDYNIEKSYQEQRLGFIFKDYHEKRDNK